MNRGDLEKLLGGYAAGTLTPEERRALFSAALADQTLFDALADEEALRETLADGACRERVLAALEEEPAPALKAWWRMRSVWALAAATAAASVVIGIVVTRPKPVEREMAMVHKAAPPAVEMPAPPLQAQPARKAEAENRAAPQVMAAPAPRAIAAPGGARANEVPAGRQPESDKDAEAENRRVPVPPSVGDLRAAGRAFTAPAPAIPAAPREEAAANKPTVAAQPAEPNLAAKLSAAPKQDVAGGMASAAPPPPASVTQSVVVEAAPAAVGQGAAAGIQGRDAAELMKVMNAQEARDRMTALAPPPAAGLHYSILRRGADNTDTEVPANTPIPSREAVRVRIEADQNGYLYVLAGEHPLFTGPVEVRQPVTVETNPGVLHIVLLPKPDTGPLSTLVSRTRHLRQDKKAAAAARKGKEAASQTGLATDILIRSR